jgi:hypothetical protein
MIENENQVKKYLFFGFFRSWNKNKFWGKYLVEILQYTMNLENFHIPASMKTKQVCIWSTFWKHGWILLKPGVQVSIG